MYNTITGNKKLKTKQKKKIITISIKATKFTDPLHSQVNSTLLMLTCK